MNKFYMTVGALAMMAASLFTSCSSNDAEQMTPLEQSKQQFAFAFNKQFGEISADQNWGFEAQSVPTSLLTRSSNANSNQWFDAQYFNYVKPADITQNEIETVRQWFATHPNPQSETVNWTDFFVQQVYNGTDTYDAIDHNGAHHNVLGANHMDYIMAGILNADGTITDDHVYNFNANSGSIMYMEKSGTSRFGYHDSYANYTSHRYTIQKITVDGVEGYYVGFDYESIGGQNGEVQGDGYYTDRIVKICPAVKNGVKRIIAEDLGSVGDFDYNDVVFDAYVYNEGNQTKAQITLQAAGGIQPIYVAGQEVHALFGVPVTTMVNTGDGATAAPVSFTVVLKDTPSSTFDVNDIPVVVKSEKNGEVTLQTLRGEAPEKICVETTYQWTKERENINSKYPGFKDFVSNKSKKWY